MFSWSTTKSFVSEPWRTRQSGQNQRSQSKQNAQEDFAGWSGHGRHALALRLSSWTTWKPKKTRFECQNNFCFFKLLFSICRNLEQAEIDNQPVHELWNSSALRTRDLSARTGAQPHRHNAALADRVTASCQNDRLSSVTVAVLF